MIKLKYFILIFLTLVIILPSCSDSDNDTGILQIDPLHDEDAIHASVTLVCQSYLEAVRRPSHHHITSLGADDITTWWGSGSFKLIFFDRFSYGEGQNADNPALLDKWENNWQTIYNANMLIAGLSGSTASVDIIKKAEAEAKFFRALSYFELVRVYGNVPLIVDTDTLSNELESRATVLQNYQLIEADLKWAEEYLPHPEEVEAPGRVSTAAAKAILANLYLTWAGWPVMDESKYKLAADKAKEIIDMNYFEMLPIQQLWLLESQNSHEAVFSVQFSEAEGFQNYYAADFCFHESRGWSDFYPERQFFFDFPDGPRKDVTFYTEIPQRAYDSEKGKIVLKDPPTVHWTDSQRKHPMFKKYDIAADLSLGQRVASYRALEIVRYPEVLLIFAEASARQNTSVFTGVASVTGEALDALNQVRRRAAGIDYRTPDVNVDLASATTNDVMDERAWEFAGENKRWHDLVRTETLAEVAADRDPTEEVQLGLNASEITWKQYIAPIPFQFITSQGNLKQNPEGFVIQ